MLEQVADIAGIRVAGQTGELAQRRGVQPGREHLGGHHRQILRVDLIRLIAACHLTQRREAPVRRGVRFRCRSCCSHDSVSRTRRNNGAAPGLARCCGAGGSRDGRRPGGRTQPRRRAAARPAGAAANRIGMNVLGPTDPSGTRYLRRRRWAEAAGPLTRTQALLSTAQYTPHSRSGIRLRLLSAHASAHSRFTNTGRVRA